MMSWETYLQQNLTKDGQYSLYKTGKEYKYTFPKKKEKWLINIRQSSQPNQQSRECKLNNETF